MARRTHCSFAAQMALKSREIAHFRPDFVIFRHNTALFIKYLNYTLP